MNLKTLWLAGLAILVAFLFAVPTAFAAIKPPKPPVPPKIVPPTPPAFCAGFPFCSKPAPPPDPKPEPVYGVVTANTVELHATNAVPGTCYGFVYKVWGNGNPTAYWRGGTAGCARSDGSYVVKQDLADVRSWAVPYELYEVEIYLYTDDYYSPALDRAGVPLYVEIEFD